MSSDKHNPREGAETEAPPNPEGDAKDASSPVRKREVATERFPIVGIGASAGGLEAPAALLRRIDIDSLAVVVVQHLSPDHESLLSILLARASSMRVLTAEDQMRVEPNHIYVIPPNADLSIRDGVLRLNRPVGSTRGVQLPIDYFFRSLAEDRGPLAIGVVLSGTGSDGTFGLRAIKEAGGVTFAQEPASAKYDGMPRSALESGAADFCM